MAKNSMKERLCFANDQCPLPGSPIPSLQHTRWYAEAHNHASKFSWLPDGYTVTVHQSKWLHWSRTFSLTPPASSGANSLITINEWLPRYEPGYQSGWFAFGSHYTSAYATLHPNYLLDWRGHARRHLKAFKQSNCTLRLGTRADVAALYVTSQIRTSLQSILMASLDQHLKVHPDTIEILVAERAGQAIACFVAGNCAEANMSEYIIGAFHPAHKHTNAMVGLVDWWYRRSLKRGLTSLTFGHMEPASRLMLAGGNGYTFFKTHFGVTRLWWPKNRWSIHINLKQLFSKDSV